MNLRDNIKKENQQRSTVKLLWKKSYKKESSVNNDQ